MYTNHKCFANTLQSKDDKDKKVNTTMDPALNRLIWIDLEMTGLDPDNDVILEIATVITDAELNLIAEGPVIAVFQAESHLANMDNWNTKQHNESGLINRVRTSQTDTAQAERLTLNFLNQHLKANQSPMCGNSICQDRRFLYRYMPKLEAFFHYRNLDVSTLKELAYRWYPQVGQNLNKKSRHLALEDIHDSIEELKYYQKQMFKS